MTLQEA